MDKDKILDYVMNTPANTNPNVLKTMLDGNSSDEINPGYSCTEITTLLTDESVTTVFDEVMNSGILAYSTSIDADTIRVTFDGTEYTCNAEEALAGKTYGAPMGEEGVDWSEYPFQIASGLRNDLYTESAGTYQIKIETVEEVVETTPCFEKAVNSVVSGGSGGGTGGDIQLFEFREIETDNGSYFDGEQVNELLDKEPLFIASGPYIFYRTTDNGQLVEYANVSAYITGINSIVIEKGVAITVAINTPDVGTRDYDYDPDSGNYVFVDGGGGVTPA